MAIWDMNLEGDDSSSDWNAWTDNAAWDAQPDDWWNYTNSDPSWDMSQEFADRPYTQEELDYYTSQGYDTSGWNESASSGTNYSLSANNSNAQPWWNASDSLNPGASLAAPADNSWWQASDSLKPGDVLADVDTVYALEQNPGLWDQVKGLFNQASKSGSSGGGLSKVLDSIGNSEYKGLIEAGLKGLVAYNQASNLGDAANTQADALLKAAQISADAAKFKPYTVTTGFGKGMFDTDKQTAEAQLSPEYQALRGKNLGLASKYFDANAGFNPDTFAADYFTKLWDVGSTDRNKAQTDLETRLLGQGMLGSTGGYWQKKSLEDAIGKERLMTELAARDQGFKEASNWAGLGKDAVSNAMALDQAGMLPLEMGGVFGGRQATAGQAIGNTLMSGAIGAADARYKNTLGQNSIWNSFWNDFLR